MPVAAGEMNLVKLHVEPFTVVGIEARTSNARETTTDAVIPKMWARLTNENLLGEIPKRVDANVVAVYSDYESDKDGPYSYLLGAKVSSAKDIPSGMISRKVVSGTYAMFTAKGGPPPQMIVDLWKRIWSLEKPGSLHRAYQTDFEVYTGAFANDPANAQVDVYIGLQK
ncbi:MAG: AraC family transcriptional regulator [Acidobacteriaceae bacterium]|nr:AraC family transcriptional regulator [Acidobacteriaceae bacterium]